jgi:hypothetical protein
MAVELQEVADTVADALAKLQAVRQELIELRNRNSPEKLL